MIKITDREQCFNIYLDIFKDDTQFTEKFFDYFFKYCYYFKENEKVISMLFAIPCTLFLEKSSYKARYVYAVATRPEFRGRGYMQSLIKDFTDKTDEVIFLKPVNEGVVEFYSHIGFKKFIATKLKDIKKYSQVLPEHSELTEEIDDGNKYYTAMYYYKEELNIDGLYFPYTME